MKDKKDNSYPQWLENIRESVREEINNGRLDPAWIEDLAIDEIRYEEQGPGIASVMIGGFLGGLAGIVGGAYIGYIAGDKIADYFEIGNQIARIGIDTAGVVSSAIISGFAGLYTGAWTLGPLLLRDYWNYERRERKMLRNKNE